MGHVELGLFWRSDSVANIMEDNNIHNRDQLSDRLERLGIARTTVYRSFTEDWRGKASATVLAAMASCFSVPLSHLVAEPFRRAG